MRSASSALGLLALGHHECRSSSGRRYRRSVARALQGDDITG
jgi:hypothetical protein